MSSPPPTVGDGLLARLRRSILVRFASVGVLNTLVDFVVYVILYAWGVTPVLANFVSTSAGLVVSFLGNSRFVFGSSKTRAREVTLFVLVAGVGIWLIQPAVILGSTALLRAWGVENVALIGGASKLLAIAVAAVWNYLLYSKLVWRRRDADGTEGTPA